MPVICVGNLSAGGSGKTPHVEYITRLLNKNYSIAVLSRGYGRQTSGFLIAKTGTDAALLGDEPFQFFLKFPETIIAVGENRKAAIEKLTDRFPGLDAIVMDDGMQHRWVKPGLLILITDLNNLFTRDGLLPAGYLREPRKNYKRADIIIVSKCPAGLSANEKNKLIAEIKPQKHQHILFSHLYNTAIRPFNQQQEIKDFAGYHVVGFTGIANPALFKSYVENVFSKADCTVFPDHHHYSDKDINDLLYKFDNIAATKKILLTTEKDFVRLKENEKLKKYPAYYLPVEVAFSENDKRILDEKILSYVGKNS